MQLAEALAEVLAVARLDRALAFFAAGVEWIAGSAQALVMQLAQAFTVMRPLASVYLATNKLDPAIDCRVSIAAVSLVVLIAKAKRFDRSLASVY